MSISTKEQSILDLEKELIINGEKVDYEILSLEPLVVVFKDILSNEECETIINLSKERLSSSKIKSESLNAMIRTSSGMFFENGENDFINNLENKFSKLMNVPKENGEGIQVLKYDVGQEFKPHFDYFKKGTPSSENNRISTLVAYLNDVEEGGETTFPSLNISVKPIKGSAVYFEYFYSDEELNKLTLHSGNPVLKGTKWALTQWMRRKNIK